MNAAHDPDPRFLEHLAWQTRTALRREGRFARPTSGAFAGLQGGLRTAALVLVSLLGGAATVVAAERLQDRRERELLLAGVEVRLETAALRRDHVREAVERLHALFEAELVSETELAVAESDLARADELVQRLELEAAEIRHSGRAPRDDLAAPLVAGRDYVTERLELSARAKRGVLQAQRLRLERVEVQFANGLVAQDTLEAARLRATLAGSALGLLEQRIGLRRDHLAGTTTSEQVELLGMRAEARARAEQSEVRIQHARRTHELVQARVRAGVANPSEARRTELDLREAEAALELARLELARIDARLGR